MIRSLTVLLATLLASTAHAAPLRDQGTGLAIDPPAGYVAETSPPRGHNAVVFSVRRQDETQMGCQIGFAPAPQNAPLTQAQINTAIEGSGWQDAAKSALAPIYNITESSTAMYGRLRGLILLADFKPRPGLPAEAAGVQTYFTIMETPRGRTTFVCVERKASFAARRPEMEAIVRGTTAP